MILIPTPAHADPYLDQAYKLYFQYHPAGDRPPGKDLYPFPGLPIPSGSDLKICPAARLPESYAHETGRKFILHGKDGGWLFRTMDFRTDYSATRKTLGYFHRINDLVSARGAKLLVVFPPPRASVEMKHVDEMPQGYTPKSAKAGYEAFLQQLQTINISAVDLSSPPENIDYYSKADLHWDVPGAEWTARRVAEALKKIPAYASIEKMSFTSETLGLNPPRRGGYEETLQRICRENIEAVPRPAWVATSVSASLLGDAKFPDIVALGTSFTANDSWFDYIGRIREYARADIYNTAIIAGGFASSAYRYFTTGEYRDHPPKIILWEFLPQHDLNSEESENGFRQIIPAIQGACGAKDALDSTSVDITSAATAILPKTNGKPLENTYIYLEITNPEQRKVQTQILYEDGNAVKVDMTRSNYAANNGRYFYELGNLNDRPALFFRVVTDIPHGHLTARLCRYPEGK